MNAYEHVAWLKGVPTRRGALLLSFSAISFSLALLVAPEASHLIIGISLFSVLFFITSWALFHHQATAADQVTVEVGVEPPVVEGVETEVSVRLVNPTKVPIELAEVSIPYPKEFRLVSGNPNVITSLPPESEIKFSYSVIPRLGKHSFPPPRLVIRDFMGLFRYEASNPVTPLEVRVLPKYEVPTARVFSIITRPAGTSRTGRSGFGTEFFGVREYTPGDEYKWIEWKATARHGMRRIFVKEFEQEISLNLFLVIDSHHSMFAGPWGRTVMEYVASAIMKLVSYSARRGDSIALMYVAWPQNEDMPLTRGGKVVDLVARYLSKIPWPESIEESYVDLPTAIRRKLLKILPRERNAILVFTTLYDVSKLPNLIDVLHELRLMGNTVMVVSPSVEYFEVQTLKGIEAAIYRLRAYRQIKFKETALSELVKRGIPAVTAGPRDIADELISRLEFLRTLS